MLDPAELVSVVKQAGQLKAKAFSSSDHTELVSVVKEATGSTIRAPHAGVSFTTETSSVGSARFVNAGFSCPA